MGGNLVGSDSWFVNFASQSQTSAHFGVGLKGEIHQYVQLSQAAWANGIIEAGSKWPYATNPNYRTISIETEDHGNSNEPVTPAQYNAVKYLVALSMSTYPTITQLWAHSAISPQTRASCPGPRWTNVRMTQLASELNLELII